MSVLTFSSLMAAQPKIKLVIKSTLIEAEWKECSFAFPLLMFAHFSKGDFMCEVGPIHIFDKSKWTAFFYEKTLPLNFPNLNSGIINMAED